MSQASIEVPFATHESSSNDMAFFSPSVFDCAPGESGAADTVSVASADMSLASLPRKISVMTACSGSGIFELATTAVKDELNCGLSDGDPPFKVSCQES